MFSRRKLILAQSMQSRRAYALIDLTISVLIIGILAGVAMPRFAVLLDDYRAEAAARKIAGDLNYVARTAANRSQAVTVNFDAAGASWTVPGLAHPDHPGVPWTVSLADSGFPATLSTVDFGGDSSVIFNVYANPDSGGSITVTSGAATRTVLLPAAGGNAVVQ